MAPPVIFSASILLASLTLLAAPARCQEEALIQKAREFRLGQEREWRRALLHYYPKIFGGSEIASGGFFLSPRGRRDPQAELEATLRAFYRRPGAPDEHALCRFPARRAWLQGRLPGGLPGLPQADCPKYRAWREKLRPSSVTLVFASAFLNNPSSMYGHTFLRLDRAGRGEDGALLDYSVNYAADTALDNGILYALYGLAGLFPGRFSVMPYYLQVQEYSNMESRDLWELELRLNAAAIDRLMDHLWELDKAVFPYFFFNKNCSYQLLPLLQASDPGFKFIRRWQMGFIPADTLREAASQSGGVARAAYRPSRITVMLARRSRLKGAEVRLAGALARGATEQAWQSLKALPQERQALVLESAQDYLEQLNDFRQEKETAAKGLRREILLARSRLGPVESPWSVAVSTPPYEGHKSARVSLGWGAAERPFVELAGRAALHDVLDPPDGYALNSGIEMFSARLRRDLVADRTYIQEADLIRILSISPYDPWFIRPSWKLDTGIRVASELDDRGWKSGYYGFGAGSGLAWQAECPGRPVVYALAEADGGLGGIFRRDYRLGGGPTGAAILQLSRLSARLEAGYRAYALGDPRPHGQFSFEAALHAFKDASLRLRLMRVASHDEAFLALHGYF